MSAAPLLRRYRPEDGPEVRRLVQTVLTEYGLWEEHRTGMLDLICAERAYLERGGEFLVARRGGRVIGCGGLFPRAGRVASIQRMYLLRQERGRGLGKRILARLVGSARKAGFKRLMLETSPRFQDAIGLYLRSGFTACVLDDDSCCNIVMFKVLS